MPFGEAGGILEQVGLWAKLEFGAASLVLGVKPHSWEATESQT